LPAPDQENRNQNRNQQERARMSHLDGTKISIDHTPRSAKFAREVEPGVFLLDHHFRGSPGVIASYLIADHGALTLIETGPASTIDALLSGVRQAGFEPEQIERVIVTHIHLDHAGGAGALLERLPRARLYVHPLGAPHMADPSRLMASATRIYGDMMGPLWGEMLPVPSDRIEILSDLGTVATGGRVLRAYDTPGHANHHLALHDPETGSVFTGDIAGVRLEGTQNLRPPTPPPEFSPEKWQKSIATLQTLAPKRLYLTHFGAHDDVSWHLTEILARTWFWAGWVGGRIASGEDPEATTDALRRMEDVLLAQSGDPTLITRYEEAGNYRMSVDGIMRWWKKRSG
jgi:glyoxylase-like metal-dependent hydrolase (beta-lactamase superfamily II)